MIIEILRLNYQNFQKYFTKSANTSPAIMCVSWSHIYINADLKYIMVQQPLVSSQQQQESRRVAYLGRSRTYYYTADVPCTEHTMMATFADDTAIVSPHACYNIANELLQRAVNKVVTW